MLAPFTIAARPENVNTNYISYFHRKYNEKLVFIEYLL